MSDVRERHFRYVTDPAFRRTGDDPEWCADCEVPWPCDAIQMADDADRLAATVNDYRQQHDTDDPLSVVNVDGICDCGYCVTAREALRQHEEATR